MVVLPRHGHRTPSLEQNFHANVQALKQLGVTEILSVSAISLLKEHLPPGTFEDAQRPKRCRCCCFGRDA